jgi:butyrate kinase
VLPFPGENELEALAAGAREVLLGEAMARTYEG